MPSILHLITRLILTTRNVQQPHHCPPDEQGRGGLTPVKGRAPLLLLTRLLSTLPPSRAGPANLGVEEKDFLAQHRDCLIDFFFQNEDLRGFHFISKRMFILATGALWQRNATSSLQGQPPGALPLPCLPGNTSISSAAQPRWREAQATPALPGGSGGTPTAALHGCLVTSDSVNMGYRRQCYEIKQEKSSGNFK